MNYLTIDYLPDTPAAKEAKDNCERTLALLPYKPDSNQIPKHFLPSYSISVTRAISQDNSCSCRCFSLSLLSTFILFTILSFLLLWTIPANAVKVESTRYNPITSRSTATSSASAFLGTGEQAFSINLSDISVDPATITGNKSGIVLPLSFPITASLLHWESISGGYVARFRVSANDQIKRVRLHLTFEDTIPIISFRVQGNLDSSSIGPVDNSGIYDGEIWLPITNGNSADLEIFVEDSSPETLNFKIDSINLILVDLSKGNNPPIVTRSLNLAESEQFDLTCWTGNAEYPALEVAASSTALISFIEKGVSYICTGTLLADMVGTLTPWFVTANHCISDQAVANTAEFDWIFQATTCGGNTTDFWHSTTVGGAQLLWSHFTNDASLLKLKNSPPPGATFNGWSTDDIQVGDPVWSVHHPNGDHTMVSYGKVTELFMRVDEAPGKYRILDTVKHEWGGTEGGSSGSGLFVVENGQSYWKGTLYGGPEGDYKTSRYSHFPNYFPDLKQWLYDPAINCLLNWAERFYPSLFSPRGAVTLESTPYTYRYYGNTHVYVGVSSLDDHVYYLGPDGILMNVGDISSWLKETGCS